MTTGERTNGRTAKKGIDSTQTTTPGVAAERPSGNGGRAPQVAGEAQQQTTRVGGETRAQVSRVSDEARHQVSEVAGEAKHQAHNLADETRDQISQQASEQQQRLASSVRQLADGLSRMARQAPSEAGLAADLAHIAAEKLHTVGTHLGNREPAQLLEDVRTFARERPGLFLTGALVGGFVTGRLVKGVASGQAASGSSSEQPAAPAEPGTPSPQGRYYTSPADPAGGAVSAGTDGDGYVQDSGEPRPAAVGAGADAVPGVIYEPARGAGSTPTRGGEPDV